MGSRRERKKGGKAGKQGHGVYIKAYRKECRRRSINEYRDCKVYERGHKEEGRVKGAKIKHLRKLIRDFLRDADWRDTARIVCLADVTFCNRPRQHSSSARRCSARSRAQGRLPCLRCSSSSSASVTTPSPGLFGPQVGPCLAYSANKPSAVAQNHGFPRAGLPDRPEFCHLHAPERIKMTINVRQKISNWTAPNRPL